MNRRLITLSRVIQAGCINFVRNISLSIAATAVMVVTLTIVLFSIIANATFSNTVQQINDKIGISVYLKDSVTEDQRKELISKFEGLSNVKSVEYVSKEKALEDYRAEKKAENETDALIAVAAVENPLPETVRIKPYDPLKIDDIRTFLETEEVSKLTDKTSYSGDRKDAIDKITKATAFFRKAVFGGVVLFAVISMLIIFNTIQMAIFNRRNEITIMRLLGAKPWYIKGPFIVETMIYGIVSAVISLSLVNFIFALQSQAFDASSLGILDISFANEYFAENFWWFVLLQFVAGMSIGAISAMIATKRYLRVSKGEKKRRIRRLFNR